MPALALVETPDDRKPWDRRPNESRQAFQAFAVYRDLGDNRSIRAVAANLSKSASLIKRWSSQHEWVKRVDAWILDEDRKKQRAHAEVIVQMAERHANTAQMAASALTVPVQAFLKRIQEARQTGEDLFVDMPIDDLYQFAAVAARLFPQLIGAERLSRGASTEITEHQGSPEKPVVVKVEWADQWRSD